MRAAKGKPSGPAKGPARRGPPRGAPPPKPRGQVGRVRELMNDANLILEVRDARGPAITSPAHYLGGSNKTRLLILTKADLADPDVTEAWVKSPMGMDQVIAVNLAGQNRAGDRLMATLDKYLGKVKSALGLVRAIVVGLPNVGKSTIINRLRKAAVARVGDQPGVTRGKLWVQITPRCFLLDTPGIVQISAELLHRSAENAWKLSLLNIVPESAIEPEETALGLLGFLQQRPELVTNEAVRGNLEASATPLAALIAFARDQGLKTRGGDPDVVTASKRLIGRFRRLELGRISLEAPGGAP